MVTGTIGNILSPKRRVDEYYRKELSTRGSTNAIIASTCIIVICYGNVLVLIIFTYMEINTRKGEYKMSKQTSRHRVGLGENGGCRRREERGPPYAWGPLGPPPLPC